MGRVIICRHGNTFDKGDVVTRVGGRTDLPLSVSGRAQAEALAEHFSGTRFSAAYCSSLQRTRATAEAILARSDAPPELKVLKFLTEIDYGPDENKPEDQVLARIGAAALDQWDALGIPPHGWRIDMTAIHKGWRGLLAEAKEMGRDATLLVVTSNGIARFLPDVVNEVPDTLEPKLKTGAWGEVEAGATSRIAAWNRRPA